MTIEQARKEFNEMIAKNRFTIAGHTGDTGNPIYHRIWRHQEDSMEVRILISGAYTMVTVKRNGMVVGDIVRDYSRPKRAINAICRIIQNAGYEW